MSESEVEDRGMESGKAHELGLELKAISSDNLKYFLFHFFLKIQIPKTYSLSHSLSLVGSSTLTYHAAVFWVT